MAWLLYFNELRYKIESLSQQERQMNANIETVFQ